MHRARNYYHLPGVVLVQNSSDSSGCVCSETTWSCAVVSVNWSFKSCTFGYGGLYGSDVFVQHIPQIRSRSEERQGWNKLLKLGVILKPPLNHFLPFGRTVLLFFLLILLLLTLSGFSVLSFYLYLFLFFPVGTKCSNRTPTWLTWHLDPPLCLDEWVKFYHLNFHKSVFS